MQLRSFYRWLIVLLLIDPLVACGTLTSSDTAKSSDTAPQTYHGIVLPTSKPIGAVPIEPPAAWLITEGVATPAASGGYCYQGACVDMTFAQKRTDLAMVTLSRPANITIVIDSRSVKEIAVRLGTWTNQPTALFDFPGMHELRVEQTTDGTLTVLTLTAGAEISNTVLVVASTFSGKDGSGDASYIWRLNPAK